MAGAAVAPVIFTSASPPLTSWGIDDSTCTLIAANADVATNAAQIAAVEAATCNILLDIGFLREVRSGICPWNGPTTHQVAHSVRGPFFLTDRHPRAAACLALTCGTTR